MGGIAERLGIEHVFVLMLENRSFDHMLGFSGITGRDAATGAETAIDGLAGTESNVFNGRPYAVVRGADYRQPTDPAHEFPDILRQLCGPAAVYHSGGSYPAIDNSGFVASYVAGGGKAPGDVMKCYTAEELPVLNALAREFVVCDSWHAPMPGPTWPNRMFVHAASSGGLDHSPGTAEIISWESLDGFEFANGTIFDTLNAAGITRRLYAGDDFPMVSALKRIHLDDIRPYRFFEADLAQANYPYRYVFIEPSYDVLNDYRSGNSQHPLADVTQGEALIKSTYEAIRGSAAWPRSLFIITWDEHGGFYDHAIPPAAKAPGDTVPGSRHNRYGFTFEQYGPRVPAVVVSPLIPRNLIDHRLYDHASIPATLEALFGLPALTARDSNANSLVSLMTLDAPRRDCPERLPAPSSSGPTMRGLDITATIPANTSAVRPDESADQGNVPAIVQAAMQQELSAWPERRQEIIARVQAIQTRADALQYLTEVREKVRPLRTDGAGQ